MMLRLVFPLLALCGARAEAQPTLWVTGDAMTSAQIRDAAVDASSPEAGIASMLEPLSELWSGARNVVIANLETPVTRRRRRAHDDGAPMRGLRAVRLNAPPYFLAGLRRSGVDALTLANNHALDQDEAGLAETLARVRASGLVPLGAGPGARAPLVVGGAVAVRVHNRYLAPGGTALEGALAYGGNEAPFGDGLDLVIVHVVGEREREVDERWRAYAETLVGAGADALIFHGTHVPLGAEALDGVPVLWGLGNLLTDMGRMASPRRRVESKITDPATRLGLVARVTIETTGLNIEALPIFEVDERFARWNTASAGEGEIRLWVHPLASCAPFANLPARWPEVLRREYDGWIERVLRANVPATGAACARPWFIPFDQLTR